MRINIQEWEEDDKLEILKGWARRGLTMEEIGNNIGISRKTIYTWLKKSPKIKEAIREGKEPADLKVEGALYKSACGYFVEEKERWVKKAEDGEETESVKYSTKYIPPNSTSIIFFLKNRRPDLWRDKHETEHSGSINNPLKGLSTADLIKLIDKEEEK